MKGLVTLKLFLNQENEVDVDGVSSKSTVQDFFDAIDDFFATNPLPCETCKQNCCGGRFKINMDSVSARKISKGKVERIIPKLFVDMGENKLEIYLVAGNKRCRHLNGIGRCLVYKERPASCRTYICIAKSSCYKILEAAIVAELHHAMRAEYLDVVLKDRATPQTAIGPAEALRQEIVGTSIAYNRNNYSDIFIKDCVKADFAHSNITADEVSLFQEILNKA